MNDDDRDFFVPVLEVKFNGPAAPLYKTSDASGCDLIASEDCHVVGGQFKLVGTGLHLEIPRGFEGQVRSRSGLAVNHGVFVLNSPGTIDADYRGEVKVILCNLGHDPFIVKKGDRIAQLVFSRVIQATFSRSEKMSQTARGSGGFGSTGI
jgi:dUTP pyrophosphatase